LVSILVLGVQLPLRLLQVRQVVEPFAQSQKFLESLPVETVIIDTNSIWYGQDLVRNRPGLVNRPQLAFLRRMNPASIAYLDGKNSYDIIGFPQLKQFGISPRNLPSRQAPGNPPTE